MRSVAAVEFYRKNRGQGRKPYGFYAGEPAVIERMQALQAAGMSYEGIAAQLNGEGVQPRAGGCWWGKTVNNILRKARPAVEDRMLEAMRQLAPAWSAPVSVRELRAALPGMATAEFDLAVLALRAARKVYLSEHDFPLGEKEEVRRLLVREGDRYFVAITARGPR